MVDLESALLWLRVVAHLVTFFAVAIWYSDQRARFRPGVSVLATIIAGSSLAAACSGAILPAQGSGPFETILFVAFAALIVRCRGNVAHLLPHRETVQ